MAALLPSGPGPQPTLHGCQLHCFCFIKKNIRERKRRGVTYHMRDLAGKTDELNLLMGGLQEADAEVKRAARVWRECAALRSRRREEDESEIKRVSAGCCSALISVQPGGRSWQSQEKVTAVCEGADHSLNLRKDPPGFGQIRGYRPRKLQTEILKASLKAREDAIQKEESLRFIIRN